MNARDRRAVDILRELGRQPAAPFFEAGPARSVTRTLQEARVPYEPDQFGNIIARLRTGGPTDDPPIAFVAHLDHPGFQVLEIHGRRALAQAMGGIPAAALAQPTPVQVITPEGRVRGITARHEAAKDPADRAADRLAWLDLERGITDDPPLPAVFDLPDFQLDGQTIRMRALDDLAGCAAILAAMERLSDDRAEPIDLYGVFSRAEEVGLLGARLIAEAGALPRDTLVVSVESSAVIPGVSQGAGPIIRAGDAAYTFCAEAEQVLAVAAERIQGRSPAFKVQRQLMSGGVCEATAFALNGYKATGLAFPLANYHNAATSIPDPDGGVASEHIQLPDFLGGVALLTEAAVCVSKRSQSRAMRWVKDAKNLEAARQRLAATACHSLQLP